MKAFEIFRSFLKSPIPTLRLGFNRLGSARKCYVCSRTFGSFMKFRGGYESLPVWHQKLEVIGSDLDNFKCQYCGASDRERHLFMYFDKLDLWSKMNGASIIHFAPEVNLGKRMAGLNPSTYIKADLFPADASIQRIDITRIPFADNVFDILICNHVIEHVPDFQLALREIFRVMKKGGFAILQTPFSRLLHQNFEDQGINSGELRLLFYGQEDHVRYFSERQFLKSLQDAGFELHLVKHDDALKDFDATLYGVNKKEDLIMVKKPLDC